METTSEFFGDLKLSREHLYEQIADRVQEIIAVNQLRPGTQLPPERQLAEELGVNRATVRAAIRLLEQRGMVNRKVGSGTFVVEVPASVVADSIERYLLFGEGTHNELLILREILEPSIASLATENATPKDLERMKACLDQIEEAYQRSDSEGGAIADADFHLALAEATQNKLIVAIVKALQRVIISRLSLTMSTTLQQGEMFVDIHRRIYEAVKNGERSPAQEAFRDHFGLARDLQPDYANSDESHQNQDTPPTIPA
jgi:GntR family transcriptional repressor for pyruvate dehydrogenase complex